MIELIVTDERKDLIYSRCMYYSESESYVPEMLHTLFCINPFAICMVKSLFCLCDHDDEWNNAALLYQGQMDVLFLY